MGVASSGRTRQISSSAIRNLSTYPARVRGILTRPWLRVDGVGPCGNVEVPPLIMWKSPWGWSHRRRSGPVANIPSWSIRSEQVLNSMCGFGPRTGARTVAEIGDPHRFANPPWPPLSMY